MKKPITLIIIEDKSPYTGPKTMEELRAQTMRMTVRDDNLEPVHKYDRAVIFQMLDAGCTLKTIAEATGASQSLLSRIKKGER